MAVNVSTPARRGELRWFSPRVIAVWNRLAPVPAFYLLAVPAISLRAAADDHGLPVRRHFNGFEEAALNAKPNEWLQDLLLDLDPLRVLAVLLYFSWHALPLLAALPLIVRVRRYEPWQLVLFMLLAYYAVQPCFFLYPLEPPWMHHGGIDRVQDLFYGRAAGQDSNPHAAMPSLHVAMPFLVALWYGLTDPVGKAFAAYSLLIGVTVIYTGDHYAADLAAGYLFAAVLFWLVRWTRLPILPQHDLRRGCPGNV